MWTKYLNRLASFCNRCAFEDIPGAGELMFQDVKLRDIFLPLSLEKRRIDELFTHNETWENDLDMEKLNDLLAHLEEAFEAPEKPEDKREEGSWGQKRVVTGAPGSGKTTLCKMICLACINGLSEIKAQYDLPDDVLPLFLDCRQLQSKGKADFFALAYEMNKAMIGDLIDLESFRTMVSCTAQAGRLFPVIDGVDSLEPETAKDFSEKFFLFMEENPRLSFLAAVRSEDVNKLHYMASIPGISHEAIPPLSERETIVFCGKWYKGVYAEDMGRWKHGSRLSGQLRKAAEAGNFMGSLCSNPRQLSYLLAVTRNTGVLPGDKTKFFEEFVALSLSGMPAARQEDIKAALSYLAFRMTKEQKISLNKEELDTLSKDCFCHLDGRLSTRVKADDITNLGGIVEKSDRKTFRFAHRQLQDYFTYHAIMNGYTDPQDMDKYPIEILCEHYHEANWNGVLTLCYTGEDSGLAGSVSHDIMEKLDEKTDEHLVDTAFQMLVDGIKADLPCKEKVFRLALKDRINEAQIQAIIRLMKGKHKKTAEEFEAFISAAYEKTFQKEQYYAFAHAIICACRATMRGESPLEAASGLLTEENPLRKQTGIQMLSILGWLRYSGIVPSLWSEDEDEVTEDVVKILLDEALCCDEEAYPSAANALLNLVLSEQIGEVDLLLHFPIHEVFARLRKTLQNPSSNRFRAPWLLLAAYPIDVIFAPGEYDGIGDTAIKKQLLGKLKQEFEEASQSREVPASLIYTFKVCALSGCWESWEQAKTAFDKLKPLCRSAIAKPDCRKMAQLTERQFRFGQGQQTEQDLAALIEDVRRGNDPEE